MRVHVPRPALGAFLLAILLSVVVAASAAAAPPTVVLGTKNFSEEYILGQLYKQALEAKGFKVSYKENIGSTELIDAALTSGKINFYPEYTGVIVQVVFHKPLSAKTAAATFKLAKSLQEKRGFTLFKATPFFDTDAIAVLRVDGREEPPEVGRGPEEGLRADARRAARVPHPQHRPRRHEADLRDLEREVHPARRDQPVCRARLRQGAGRRGLLDRPAARPRLEVRRPAGPEAPVRLPERGAGRLEGSRRAARPEVPTDGRRGQLEADDARRSSR